MFFPDDKTEGAWRLIALNSNGLAGEKGLSAKQHLEKAEQFLKENAARCVLAFSHYFFYSSGRHGHGGRGNAAPRDSAKRAAKKMKPVYQLLYDHKASLFIAGHDHHYEQLGRSNAKGKPAPDGIRSFVVGTGGGHIYAEPYKYRWEFKEKSTIVMTYGILKLELFATRYEWKFIQVSPEGGKEALLTVSKDTCNAATATKQ